MAKTRRKTLTPPTSSWERTLEEQEGPDRSQAGELEPGAEEGGGGNKGIDADTGDGGYGGDAALEGYDESTAQAQRPVDREIHGDPRTHEGESYPEDVVVDPEQETIGRALDNEDRNEDL
jgi:hypothetical protein